MLDWESLFGQSVSFFFLVLPVVFAYNCYVPYTVMGSKVRLFSYLGTVLAEVPAITTTIFVFSLWWTYDIYLYPTLILGAWVALTMYQFILPSLYLPAPLLAALADAFQEEGSEVSRKYKPFYKAPSLAVRDIGWADFLVALSGATGADHPRVTCIKDVQYGAYNVPNGKGDDGKLLCDVYFPKLHGKASRPGGQKVLKRGRPVLLWIHGGAWTRGRKDLGCTYFLNHVADALGWCCVSVSYRKSPQYAWPCHLDDVKQVFSFLRRPDVIERFDLDPDFITTSGQSAGDHMASLCGLDPALGVKAVISFNGVYDWVRRNDAATFVETSDMEHNKFVTFLSNEVVQKPWDTADTYSFEQRLEGKKRTGASANSSVLSAHAVSKNAIYYHASPVHLLPFADPKQIPAWFVLKGTHDNLVSLSQYARFVEALKKYGVVNPVAYSSVPYGGHSFEAVPCLKMALVTQAIECFLKTVYAQHYDLAST